ncbi:MAG: class I SAM-dependent methyltransferase, partial [Candidatus Hydrogenedentales bacterium]
MVIKIADRVLHEKRHGAMLAATAPEDIWNWSSAAGRARAERRAGFFAAIMPSDARCLEIGCGTGYFTRLVAGTGAAITAVDISGDLLSEARRKSSASNVRYEVADVHALPYGDGSFDVIFGSSVLHHLDIQPALRECLRVLMPGGRMVFAEPNMLNPQIWAERHIPFLRNRMGVSPDETAFVRFTLARRLLALGFVNVAVSPHEFLHPAIPEALIPLGQMLTRMLEKAPLIRE